MESLDDATLGLVLRPLDPDSLRAARLACKRLDAAARRAAGAFTVLKISPSKINELRPPDLARWPRLAAIELSHIDEASEHLPALFVEAVAATGAPAVAALSRVERFTAMHGPVWAMSGGRASSIDAIWMLLFWFPGLRYLDIDGGWLVPGEPRPEHAVSCADEWLESLARHPHLVSLRLPVVLNDAGAALLGAHLPKLEHLRFTADSGPARLSAAGWAALPHAALRQLRAGIEGWDASPLNLGACRAPPGAAGIALDTAGGATAGDSPPASPPAPQWPVLAWLGGVEVPGEQLRLLAWHAPNLRCLIATATGDWALGGGIGGGGGSLPALLSVRSALITCGTPSVAAAPLSALLPSVERLCLDMSNMGLDDRLIPPPAPVEFQLAGLTALTQLQMGCLRPTDCDVHIVGPACLRAAAALPRLRHLQVDCAAGDLPCLAGAGARLETLQASLLDLSGQHESHMWIGLEPQPPTDLGTALLAVAPLRGLRDLLLAPWGGRADVNTLAAFARAAPPHLTALTVAGVRLDAADVATLATVPTLLQLWFDGREAGEDADEEAREAVEARFARLSLQLGPRGRCMDLWGTAYNNDDFGVCALDWARGDRGALVEDVY